MTGPSRLARNRGVSDVFANMAVRQCGTRCVSRLNVHSEAVDFQFVGDASCKSPVLLQYLGHKNVHYGGR
jgi:hypothetical protein